jgi:hypothetical protein
MRFPVAFHGAALTITTVEGTVVAAATIKIPATPVPVVVSVAAEVTVEVPITVTVISAAVTLVESPEVVASVVMPEVMS